MPEWFVELSTIQKVATFSVALYFLSSIILIWQNLQKADGKGEFFNLFIVSSIIYAGGVVITGVFLSAGFVENREWQLNSIGDYLAGCFAPLAFFWFVYTATMQRKELNNAMEAYKGQTEQLSFQKEEMVYMREEYAAHKVVLQQQEEAQRELARVQKGLVAMQAQMLEAQLKHNELVGRQFEGDSLYQVLQELTSFESKLPQSWGGKSAELNLELNNLLSSVLGEDIDDAKFHGALNENLQGVLEKNAVLYKKVMEFCSRNVNDYESILFVIKKAHDLNVVDDPLYLAKVNHMSYKAFEKLYQLIEFMRRVQIN